MIFFVFCLAINCKKEANLLKQTEGEVFYYFNNEKIYLYEVKGSFAIQLDTSIAHETALEKLKKNSNIQHLVTLQNANKKVEVISAPKYTLEDIKKTSGVINAMHRYVSDSSNIQGKNILTMNGSIVYKAKQNVSATDVLNVINNGGKVTDNKYIEVSDWDKLFGYINKLYESGLVEYSEPDFWGGFSLFQ